MNQNPVSTEPAPDITSAAPTLEAEPRNGFVSSAAAFHDILAVGAQPGTQPGAVLPAGDTNGTRPTDRPADAAPAGDVPELGASTDFFATTRPKQPFWRISLSLPKRRTAGHSKGRRPSKGGSPLPHS